MNKYLKKLQKDSGIKQSKFDNEHNRLYNAGQTILKVIENFIKQVEDAEMTDEQFFLDWSDKINEYSVKY